MSLRVCENGHRFEKTSDCPVCPICSSQEMKNVYGEEFPNLSAPAFRALNSVGIKKLSDLSRFSEKDLLSLHGFGPKGLRLLKEELKKQGLSFKKS